MCRSVGGRVRPRADPRAESRSKRGVAQCEAGQGQRQGTRAHRALPDAARPGGANPAHNPAKSAARSDASERRARTKSFKASRAKPSYWLHVNSHESSEVGPGPMGPPSPLELRLACRLRSGKQASIKQARGKYASSKQALVWKTSNPQEGNAQARAAQASNRTPQTLPGQDAFCLRTRRPAPLSTLRTAPPDRCRTRSG